MLGRQGDRLARAASRDREPCLRPHGGDIAAQPGVERRRALARPRVNAYNVRHHMATPDLLRSWKRTEAFLRDARAHLSQIAEAEFADAIAEFEEFIDHNELGLAFDTLESIACESRWEPQRVRELLALAAASMGLHERQRALDEQLTNLKGWKYETLLPAEDA